MHVILSRTAWVSTSKGNCITSKNDPKRTLSAHEYHITSCTHESAFVWPYRNWSVKHQRLYLDEHVAPELRVHMQSDWYSQSRRRLRVSGVSHLVPRYKYSLPKLLRRVYPEFSWDESMFRKVLPRGYWLVKENRQSRMEFIAENNNVKIMSDWYKIKAEKLVDDDSRGLLQRYGYSLIGILQDVYPMYKWEFWRFSSVSHGFWDNPENTKKVLKAVADTLGIVNMNEWYNVSKQEFVDNGGSAIVQRFNGSLITLLKHTIPEFNWVSRKFKHVPSGYWQEKSNVIDLMNDIEVGLKVKCAADWYRVSRTQMHTLGGATVVRFQYPECLFERYPYYSWSTSLLARTDKRANQRMVFLSVQECIPREKVVEEFNLRNVIGIEAPAAKFTVDIYVPKYKLGFEYQGEHHYADNSKFGPTRAQKDRDSEKKRLCAAQGVTIIDIPYWWDSTTESIAGTIAHERPDIPLSKEFIGFPPIPTKK